MHPRRGTPRSSHRTVTLERNGATLALVLQRATTSSLAVIGQVRSNAGETVSTSSAPSVSLSAQNAAAAGVTSVSDMVWNQLATTPVIPLGGGSNATVSFALRGPDPTETVVDIDGHSVNNGNTGDFDLSLIDPAALQSVQLVYGISPSSLVGPNTLGGAINILTLEPTTTPHLFLRGFGGSFGSFGETIQGTGSSDRFGYAFSLHRATSSGQVNQSVLAGHGCGRPAGRRPNDSKRRQRILRRIGARETAVSNRRKRRLRLSAVILPRFGGEQRRVGAAHQLLAARFQRRRRRRRGARIERAPVRRRRQHGRRIPEFRRHGAGVASRQLWVRRADPARRREDGRSARNDACSSATSRRSPHRPSPAPARIRCRISTIRAICSATIGCKSTITSRPAFCRSSTISAPKA